jgi:pSer/pThr/pTyr-binding forkhead associated (FHA) protein
VTAERSWLRQGVARFRRAGIARVPAVRVALPADGPVLVGRSHRCDVVLEHPTVSRRHLELRPAGEGEWLATDVGSLNGTWLQNRRVGRAIVVPGDELWLGSCPVRLD